MTSRSEPRARIAEALIEYQRRAMRLVYPLTDAASEQADAIIAHLRASGWIIVRHDAIRLAQAHARAEDHDKDEFRKIAP